MRSRVAAFALATAACGPIAWSIDGTSSVAAPAPRAAQASDRAAVWKRFAIRDIAIGTPVARLVGFTCARDGEVCERDLGHGEYLRVKYVAVDGPRIYEIEYRFRNTDYLSPDSQLGRALIQKYGRPEVLEPEYRQRALWEGKDGAAGPQLEISCGSGTCTLTARDTTFRFEENQRKERLDIARRKATAGPPPKL